MIATAPATARNRTTRIGTTTHREAQPRGDDDWGLNARRMRGSLPRGMANARPPNPSMADLRWHSPPRSRRCWLPRNAPWCCCCRSREEPCRRSDTLPRPPIRCGPRPFSRPRAVRCRFVCPRGLPAHFYTLLRPPALSPPCCTQRQWCARTTRTLPQDASALDAACIGRCCKCIGHAVDDANVGQACAVGHTGLRRTAPRNAINKRQADDQT